MPRDRQPIKLHVARCRAIGRSAAARLNTAESSWQASFKYDVNSLSALGGLLRLLWCLQQRTRAPADGEDDLETLKPSYLRHAVCRGLHNELKLHTCGCE